MFGKLEKFFWIKNEIQFKIHQCGLWLTLMRKSRLCLLAICSTELGKHLQRGFFSQRFNCTRCRIASARYCGCLPRVCGFATRKLSTWKIRVNQKSIRVVLTEQKRKASSIRAWRDEELAISSDIIVRHSSPIRINPKKCKTFLDEFPRFWYFYFRYDFTHIYIYIYICKNLRIKCTHGHVHARLF